MLGTSHHYILQQRSTAFGPQSLQINRLQECVMTFASLTHKGEELNLMLPSEQGDISNYESNSEFELISVKIFPSVLISVMGLLGFFVPPDTGEKATLCITTTLSMGVFLKTISDAIPPTADVPLIGIYYVVTLFIVCMATAVSAWNLNLNREGFQTPARHVPKWARKWILHFLGRKVLCIRFKSSVSASKVDSENIPDRGKNNHRRSAVFIRNDCTETQKWAEFFGHQNPMPRILPAIARDRSQIEFFADLTMEMEKDYRKIVCKVYRTLENNMARQNVYDEKIEIIAEWRNLAEVVDRVLLFVYVAASVLTTFFLLFEPALLHEQLRK